MIEDFVSFDLAKKLKEKGYPQADKNALAMYNQDDEWYSLSPTLDDFYYDFRDFDENDCVCPTISQVLKWLRDSNAIHIPICLYSKGWYCDVYTYEYYKEYREYGAKHIVQLDEFSTYEEAALAGIEYVIDNLI